MILVDTSVWADHYRQPMRELEYLLEREQIVQHPFVTAELALGNPRNRAAMLEFLQAIDQAQICSASDLLAFIEIKSLFGTGIGFVDAHLLASAARSNHQVWSRDKRMVVQAQRLGCTFEP